LNCSSTLDATEEQLNFPTFYGSGKNGWFNDSLEQTDNITPLLGWHH
jgi:GTP-binding protein